METDGIVYIQMRIKIREKKYTMPRYSPTLIFHNLSRAPHSHRTPSIE